VRKHAPLYLSLVLFILFNISIQIFMPYLILYYEVSLGMTDYVLIMAPAIILAAVVTAFYGRRSDRLGYSRSIMPALGMLMIGYVLLYLVPHVIPAEGLAMRIPVFIGSLFMMSGYLAGMAVFGAVIRDNTPVGKSGRLQGVRIFSQVLVPGIIGPAIGKKVLENAELIQNSDGTTSFVPNENIFLAAAVVLLLVFPFFLKKKEQ
jgi:MFS family permease